MVAVQRKDDGSLVELFLNKESAAKLLSRYEYLEGIDTENAACIEVYYSELSGPNGYGCNILEYTTYGSVKRVIVNLKKWMQSATALFGPDYRDVKDYLSNCHVYLNHKNVTDKWLDEVNRLCKRGNIFI